MRICLVAHGFPPEERTGVETYTAALAAALVRAGHPVEVFSTTRAEELGHLALRREVRTDGYGLTSVALHEFPQNPAEALDPPGVAARFGEWLDRERPDVVHFQHVIKLGLGLIEEAHARAIPIVYTVHDFYPVCHRYTLLRPDLSICPEPDGEDVCARCDLGAAVLNAVPDIGDYQMGVPRADLPKPFAARLAGVLDGDPVAEGGFHENDWDKAKADRAALDARRAEVYALVDLALVPSRFMGDQVARSGLERIEYLPYGIPSSDLVELAERAPVAEHGGPLRIGYIGGLSKHKGIDVLLDAFGLLMRAHPAEATLTVHGYSSDKPYVQQLARRAAEVGARWAGPYERPDLPEVLAELDVVVVPSTWYENAPIAIREALAAGRPVVTSRLGALSESVAHDRDGLLFEPGDAQDLARTLATLLDPAEVRRLAAGIEPVITMDANADSLVGRYQALVDANDERVVELERLDALPASLADFAQATSNLERAPLRELFEHVVGGLGRLGRALELPEAARRADRLVLRAFADGDEAQRSLRDARHEVSWLRRSLAGLEESRRSHAEYVQWSETTLADRDATIQSLRAELEDARAGRTALEERAEWLESGAKANETARQALERDKASLEEEAEWLRGVRADLEAERDWLKGEVEARDAHLGGLLGEHQTELEELRNARRQAEEALADARAEILAVQERIEAKRAKRLAAERAWAELVAKLAGPLVADSIEADPEQEAGPGRVAEQVLAAQAQLTVLLDELRWRTAEMQAAGHDAATLIARHLAGYAFRRSALRGRIDGWSTGRPEERP